MRTQQLADSAGVKTQTLRYYERRGLLPEPPRTAAGYRDYPRASVRVIRFVKRAQRLGFTLDEIEHLLELDAGAADRCDRARAVAVAQLAEIDRKIADLRGMRASLGALVEGCQRSHAEQTCPLLDSISAALDQDGDRP